MSHPHLEKAAIAHRKTAEDNLKIADEQAKSASAGRRAWNKLGEWIDISNSVFEEWSARSRGDVEKAEGIKKIRDQYEAGASTRMGRTMAYERLHPLAGAAPGYTAEQTFKQGGDVYVIVSPGMPPMLIEARNAPADTAKEPGRVKKITPTKE